MADPCGGEVIADLDFAQGGYGDSLDRDASAVARDVADGRPRARATSTAWCWMRLAKLTRAAPPLSATPCAKRASPLPSWMGPRPPA